MATGCDLPVVTEGHVIPCKCPCGVLYDVRVLFVYGYSSVSICGGATGSHVTGSHVTGSHVTGSHVSHMTGSDASHVHCPQVYSAHAQPEVVPYPP